MATGVRDAKPFPFELLAKVDPSIVATRHEARNGVEVQATATVIQQTRIRRPARLTALLPRFRDLPAHDDAAL
jgi:hypothetical protein